MNNSTIHKTLLVIGNGFDLDLNLKTSYGNFLNSHFFTDNLSIGRETSNVYYSENINIFDYLKGCQNIKGWIDVEAELGNLASRKVQDLDENNRIYNRLAKVSEKEKSTFQDLRMALFDYLQNLNYNDVNENSLALELLKILNEKENVEIITFNYTDINKLASFINCDRIEIPISYMHGSLTSRTKDGDTSIILGFQDDIEIDDSYCFMIKSHSPYYTSHNIKSKLDQADEVIFFGHSLGSTDYPYFADFFRKQCVAKPDNEKIKVRIFTYDEESRQNILIQLRNMNEKHTQMLYEYCDFKIYRTANHIDDVEIQKYMGELNNDNKSMLTLAMEIR